MAILVKSVSLHNYRRFSAFNIRLTRGNVLVGPNNSGKSSILDAFRILEACFRYSRSRNPSLVEIEGKGVFYGYDVPENVMPFRLNNIAHNYSPNDSVVEFVGSNGNRAVLRMHPDRATRFYIDVDGTKLNTSSKFRAAFPVELVIIPTLAPLEAEEAYVTDETVRRNSATRLASRVLRNIWLRASQDEFESFRTDVQSAWPSAEIQKPELRSGSTPPIVHMFFSEDRIDREVQWAGFGFQVWLQIQTHLRRAGQNSILIIDEPDIYLHPDLQRRLLRIVRSRVSQFLMATHAVEIINEADSTEIVSIVPKYRSSKRINTEDDYSALFRYLGASGNADFARIAKWCIR